MTAMANVSKLPPPRISKMSHDVITEIADRTGASVDVVMQAMLLTSLSQQRVLMDNIKKLAAVAVA